MTVQDAIRQEREFGNIYNRAIVIRDGAIKADYVGEDFRKLANGTFFDSTLETSSHYTVGNTVLLFVQETVGNPIIDRTRGYKRRKWSSYTVTKDGHVTWVTNAGESIVAKDMRQLETTLMVGKSLV